MSPAPCTASISPPHCGLQVLAVLSPFQLSNWDGSQLFHSRAAHHFISLPSKYPILSPITEYSVSFWPLPVVSTSYPILTSSYWQQCLSAPRHPPTLHHLTGNNIWNKRVISYNEINFAMLLTSDLLQLPRICSPALQASNQNGN